MASWSVPDLRTIAAPGSAATGPTAEEAAYQRGWDEGRQALLADDEATLATRLTTLAAVERSLADAATLLQARFAESVNVLALGIARHVVGSQFESDPTLMRDLLARALEMAPLAGPITVHLHPDDLESIRDMETVRRGGTEPVELRWVADASVLRGGCVVEGPASVVDGRIDRVLLDIYERLSSD